MAFGCDAWVNVTVRVVDENGNNLSKAIVIIRQGDNNVFEKETDLGGLVHVNSNVCPMPGCSSDFSVTASKSGYLTATKHFVRGKNHNGTEETLVVELKKE